MTDGDAHTAEAGEELEEILLGGPRRYTRAELAQRSQVPLDFSRRLWRAMGFADVGDDERIFTDGDLSALHAFRELKEAELIDDEMALTSTRALGQQLSRLAAWQVGILTQRLVELNILDAENIEPAVSLVAEQVLPDLERILVLVWRRQLAVHGPRTLAAVTQGASRTLTVGFADIVNYTRLSRGLQPDALERLLEQFESRTTLLLSQHGGQLVKTLGDEVLFLCDEVTSAVEVALGLLEMYAADDDAPELRIGLACGDVLSRLGDVYGEPVNIASRLTSLARPGSALVDRAVASALAGNAAYEVRSLPRQQVRGYRHLEAAVVRRADQ
ncbi:MAG: adenylate/guanylate cyclase domain-containing protein [Actinomycetes bacterium]